MPLMTIRAKRLSNAIIRNLITAQEFDDLVSADGRDIEFADLIARPGQLSAVAASPTAMAAVAVSPTAMAAVAASPTAMAAMAASPTARDAVNASPAALAAIDAAGGRSLVAWIVVPAGLNPDDYEDMAAVAVSPTAMAAVAASPTAMAAVIASPTAMAAVAASPTAMAAFYSSPHIVSVPTMTSNSTPAGLCIASSEKSADEAAWKAFDGIVSPDNGVSVWGAATGNAGEWIGYQFSQSIRVSRCLFSPNGGGAGAGHHTTGIEIQGEFGGVWTTVSTATLVAGTPATTTLDFSSAQSATKWRVRSTTAAQSYWWRVTRLDFLGVAA